MAPPGRSRVRAQPVQRGTKSAPTTYAPYDHYVYKPNKYIAESHPDMVYRPRKLLKYNESGDLAVETPLDDFFSDFNTFTYNAYASVTDEFNRLLLECLGWDVRVKHSEDEGREPQDVREVTKRFNKVLFAHFRLIFGVEYTSLRAWQVLFKALGADPLPKSEDDCRSIISGVYVNMIDVLDSVRINRLGVDYKVPLFETERALSKYTREHHRHFPFWAAQRSGLLKVLLRRIAHPSEPRGDEKIHASFDAQRRKMLNESAVGRVKRQGAWKSLLRQRHLNAWKLSTEVFRRCSMAFLLLRD